MILLPNNSLICVSTDFKNFDSLAYKSITGQVVKGFLNWLNLPLYIPDSNIHIIYFDFLKTCDLDQICLKLIEPYDVKHVMLYQPSLKWVKWWNNVTKLNVELLCVC
ncbi:hypothetical protein [Salmon gill poxvirus]|uniref:Uncharacterized protein n=1 Tax=Salmon gill poxvirus TaxID=1680908 RepID=A0A0H4XWP1_9POXV|nr:hypothetical protein AL387_gp117 [Salmon gill poxvirus]AKR04241.1 hypothetical protein SGPV117 [Salmon gill poxvirus]